MGAIKMNIKNVFLVATTYILIIHTSLLAQSSHLRKINWTAAQTKEWALKNQDQLWHGWLLYQGSDSTTHHFISRVFDDWVWFNIDKTEVVMEDERTYKQRSKTIGYYYVDATNDFIKTKDY
jgi:hypothetical protein